LDSPKGNPIAWGRLPGVIFRLRNQNLLRRAMPEAHSELLSRVTALIERSESLGVDLPADTGYFEVDPKLIHNILCLLREAIELLGEIGGYFEAGGGKPDPTDDASNDGDFLRDIGLSISSELATRELADLALMGRSELRDLHGRLELASTQKNFWNLASTADTCVGRIGRALIPLESAMRDYEDLPPKRRRWEDLDDSLEIRRQYGMLWRTVLRAGDSREDQLPGALRRVAQRIAVLRQHTIYPFLRIDDRLSIRKLQKRIGTCLDREGLDRESLDREGLDREDESPRRLWNDVVSSFRLLMQINQRHEIQEHDRELVLSTYCDLSRRRGKGERIPYEILSRVDSLLGRDDDLDQLLLRPESHTLKDGLAVLGRMSQELLRDSPSLMTLRPAL
jgi:hypothetical protein